MKTQNTIKTACLAMVITLLAILPIDAQIQLQGLETNHEGLAAWNADGTGNETEALGHHFYYRGYTWYMAYYVASRDYNNIDPDNEAAMCRFTAIGSGFPNLKFQLNKSGFTLDQLKIKSGISGLGENMKGKDWGLDGNIHWYRHYGNLLTIELAGQPILQGRIDTNYCLGNLDDSTARWSSYTSFAHLKDVSFSASNEAQMVANAFLRDLNGRPIKLSTAGSITKGKNIENGRDGVFHEITSGSLTIGETAEVQPQNKHSNTKQQVFGSKETTNSISDKVPMTNIRIISAKPNPFRHHVKIAIELSEAENIKLEIYNLVGAKVASLSDGHLQDGMYEFTWDPLGLMDGIYFCRLQAGYETITKKIIKL
jgi:hypothetical protein